ncbi:MAG TPA: aminopeptidase [Bacteroidia bacterium]|jgi:predicted aminopeptidase|nr:aminopeptidase [Bacteroidia bacterium]
MKPRWKKIIRYTRAILSDAVFIPLFTFCILNTSLVVYGLRMAKGQFNIVWNARDVKDVLADKTVSDSVKEKLRLINEIKQFAYDSIGLTRSNNYTTFYDQHGQRLMYVVTACDPFALNAHLWHFPFLGDVPYKGFFDKEKADAEKLKWANAGFDTDIGGASGWSTLGYFKDPILSQMLQYNEGDLAELIIHELTHGTVFVKDDVNFNENLASFVGYKGALWFLERKYGKDSKQYDAYVNGRTDEKTLNDFMLSSAHLLDSVYKSFPASFDKTKKLAAKNAIFDSIIVHSKNLPFAADTLFPKRLAMKMQKSGNCMFMQYVRYEAKQDDFEKEYAKFSGLKAYVEYLKKKYPSV